MKKPVLFTNGGFGLPFQPNPEIAPVALGKLGGSLLQETFASLISTAERVFAQFNSLLASTTEEHRLEFLKTVDDNMNELAAELTERKKKTFLEHVANLYMDELPKEAFSENASAQSGRKRLKPRWYWYHVETLTLVRYWQSLEEFLKQFKVLCYNYERGNHQLEVKKNAAKK